jgi:hypothetical protein
MAGPASAWELNLSGAAVCDTSDGHYNITWTVQNPLNKDATITAVDATPSAVSGLVGLLPANSSATGTTTAPGSAHIATIDVSVHFPNGLRTGFQKQLSLSGECAKVSSPTPTPSVSPPASPTPAPLVHVTTAAPSPSVKATSSATVVPSVAPTEVIAPPAATAAPRAALPFTGASDTGALIGWGIGLAAAGAGVVAMTFIPRRSRTKR